MAPHHSDSAIDFRRSRGGPVVRWIIDRPGIVGATKQGRFPFDPLVRCYDFDEINQADEHSERGIAIKPILRIARAPIAARLLRERIVVARR